MNCFLKTRAYINVCTQFLRQHNLIEHALDCKNFDIAKITPIIEDGNLLDMGADGSFILHNAIRRNIKGRKVGVDLLPVSPDNRAEGAEYYQSDLMHTPFSNEEFQTITCLSVIEHQVDYTAFALETSRLLKDGGKLFITFDYWDKPKQNTEGKKLYGLHWNILDKKDVETLIAECNKHGLYVSNDIDWTTQEQVINPRYCSPMAGIAYTFGILMFVKKASSKKKLSASSANIRQAVLGSPVSPVGMERNDTCLTLLGEKRLDNFIELIYATKDIEGAVMETGVWKGGACMMAKAILNELKSDKKLFVCDSFDGMPPVTSPKDTIDYTDGQWEWLRIPLKEVKHNFKKYKLLDNKVIFVKGFFSKSLIGFNTPLSVLRTDCDMYDATMDVMNNCYHLINKGGYMIVDDYAIPPCRQAIDDFRAQNNITNEMIKVDWTGVYWKV